MKEIHWTEEKLQMMKNWNFKKDKVNKYTGPVNKWTNSRIKRQRLSYQD